MYALIDIGCLECDIESKLVGIYESEEKATQIGRILYDKHGFLGAADHSYEVFKLGKPNETHPDYDISELTNN